MKQDKEVALLPYDRSKRHFLWAVFGSGDYEKCIEAAQFLHDFAGHLHAVTQMPAANCEAALYMLTFGVGYPYVLERNLKRWPDGLWHMVDRGYRPIKGITFTRQEIDALGFAQWVELNKFSCDADGNIFPVMPWGAGAPHSVLDTLAGLLQRTGLHLETKAEAISKARRTA